MIAWSWRSKQRNSILLYNWVILYNILYDCDFLRGRDRLVVEVEAAGEVGHVGVHLCVLRERGGRESGEREIGVTWVSSSQRASDRGAEGGRTEGVRGR